MTEVAEEFPRLDIQVAPVSVLREVVLPLTEPSAAAAELGSEPVLETRGLTIRYGLAAAVADVDLNVPERQITAIIGPSGCGKSTLLRAFNRMNDFIPNAVTEGQVLYRGEDLYTRDVDPVDVRRRIAMVFQKPNPFPASVFANVAYGPRIHGLRNRAALRDLVEECLRKAALWDEVKDKLHSSAYSLSGGQQQRLCLARALAVEPEVLLMDEPCSALDPIATTKIEDLMHELKSSYTIVIVTHNMQQAARVSDYTGFFWVDEHRTGRLVEFDTTHKIFTNPADPRTEAYVTGRMG